MEEKIYPALSDKETVYLPAPFEVSGKLRPRIDEMAL